MMKIALAVVLTFGSMSHLFAQSDQTSALRALYVQDQRDRGVPMADDAIHDLPKEQADKLPDYDWEKEVPKRDEARREQARKLLGKPGLTGEGYYYAAYIFQHGQSGEDYLYAHILATEAIAHGYSHARWISAATLDRFLQQIGQKQVFGTQYEGENLAYYLQHRSDPDVVKKYNALSDQQTLEPYAPQIISDVVRADFCVPNLASQQQHIADVKAGRAKPSEIPTVKDCPYK